MPTIFHHMSNRDRFHSPGLLYHVMLRGNGQQDIFLESSDYERFKSLVAEGVERFDHRIHAFCLMTNHVHLLLQVGQLPISHSIHNIAFRYAKYFNKKHKRVGHLFQERYRAKAVRGQTYFNELIRYVHLNPVKAGIVKRPEEYAWTSHLAYLGKNYLPWLTVDMVLRRFDHILENAHIKYLNFINAALDDPTYDWDRKWAVDGTPILEDSFTRGLVLGVVKDRVTKTIDLQPLADAVCNSFGISQEELISASKRKDIMEARTLFVFLAREDKSVTFLSLARFLRRNVSSVSRLAVQAAKKMGKRSENCNISSLT